MKRDLHAATAADSGLHELACSNAIEACLQCSGELILSLAIGVDALIRAAAKQAAGADAQALESLVRTLDSLMLQRGTLAETYVSELRSHLLYLRATGGNDSPPKALLDTVFGYQGLPKTDIAAAKLAKQIDIVCRTRLQTLQCVQGIARRTRNVQATWINGDLFADALKSSLTACKVPDDVSAVWIQIATAPMMSGLDEMFDEMVAILHRAGLTSPRQLDQQDQNQLLIQGLLQKMSDPIAKYGFDLGTIQNDGMLTQTGQPARPNLSTNDLAGLIALVEAQSLEPMAHGECGLAQAFPGLSAVRNMVCPPKVTGGLSPAGAANLTEKVMALILASILDTTWIRPGVRGQIQRLEPKILRIAAKDPTILSSPSHPVRGLLDAVIYRSAGYSSDTDRDYRKFLLHVQAAVDRFVMSTGNPFIDLLEMNSTLERGWLDDDKTLEKDKPTRMFRQIRLRNTTARVIYKETIRRLPDVLAAPAFVQEFIRGPWINVIAILRIHGSIGGLTEQVASQVLTGLVLTTDSKWVYDNRDKAVRHSTVLLSLLRKGGCLVEWSPSYPPANEFCRRLEEHQSALLKGKTWDSIDPTEPTSLSLIPKFWLTPTEHDFIATVAVNTSERESGAMEEQHPLNATDTVSDIDTLGIGSWVELLKEDTWTRFEVNWCAQNDKRPTAQFMLVARGGTTVTMTLRQMQRLADDGRLRVLLPASAVTQAMDSVLYGQDLAVV